MSITEGRQIFSLITYLFSYENGAENLNFFFQFLMPEKKPMKKMF